MSIDLFGARRSANDGSSIDSQCAFLDALLVAALLVPAAGPAAPGSSSAAGCFTPEELGLLEGPDRDDWQQPDQVMDHLGISDGARVADIGAGGGWFTVRLARRVGPNGVVYAEDIQRPMIESIARRVKREGLTNVQTILGTSADPHLPAGLHAVLMVDTYTQLSPIPVPLLKRIAAGTRAERADSASWISRRDGAGGPGPPLEDRVSPDDDQDAGNGGRAATAQRGVVSALSVLADIW